MRWLVTGTVFGDMWGMLAFQNDEVLILVIFLFAAVHVKLNLIVNDLVLV